MVKGLRLQGQAINRGSGGHVPPGNFVIFDPQRVLLRPSDKSFEAFFDSNKAEKYPPPSKCVCWGGGRGTSALPISQLHLYNIMLKLIRVR